MTSKGIFGIAVATLAVSTLLAGCAGYHGSNAASAAIYSGEEPVSYTHLTLPTICSV